MLRCGGTGGGTGDEHDATRCLLEASRFVGIGICFVFLGVLDADGIDGSESGMQISSSIGLIVKFLFCVRSEKVQC